MIDKLTAADKDALHLAAAEQIEQFLDTSFRRETYEKAVAYFYDQLGLDTPDFVWCSSPFDVQQQASAHNAHGWTHGKNINKSLWSFIGENIASDMLLQARQKLNIDVLAEIKKLAWDPVDLVVKSQVESLVYNQAYKQLRAQNKHKIEFARHLQKSDAGWLTFLTFLRDKNWAENAHFEQLQTALSAGGFCGVFFEGKALVCPPPSSIALNEDNRLNSAQGKAIVWKDDFGLYCWNGIEVDRRLIMNPMSYTKNDIVHETNVEKRRCIQERLGSERFAELLGLVEMDSDLDPSGHMQYLYRTIEPDNIVNDFLYFAKVVCPTSKRIYFLSVPPGLTNVWDAVAWTFGRDSDSYKPVLQS